MTLGLIKPIKALRDKDKYMQYDSFRVPITSWIEGGLDDRGHLKSGAH